jgi:hypothetical protein
MNAGEWEEDMVLLLKSLIQEGLWMWEDGDDEYLSPCPPPPKSVYQVAASALRQYGRGVHELQGQVHSAKFVVRAAMIEWLVSTSTAVQDLDTW